MPTKMSKRAWGVFIVGGYKAPLLDRICLIKACADGYAKRNFILQREVRPVIVEWAAPKRKEPSCKK
jgi:hypothetical protein